MLGAPVSPGDDARMWRAFALAADCPPLVASFERLLSKPAPLSGPPAVVHGDTDGLIEIFIAVQVGVAKGVTAQHQGQG